MLFNRQGLQQKNWRMVKKGKHILFGCSLFFVVGAVNISGPQVTYAGDINGLETVSKQEKNSSVGEENLNATIPTLEKEKQTQSSGNKSTEKITASETVGVFIDKKELDINNYSKVLILDKVQDPGNLGTIIRTADAFNFDCIILGKGTTSLYGQKVIRSTQGSNFHIDCFDNIDLVELIDEMHEFNIFATSLKADKYIEQLDNITGKVAVVFGNEGAGVSEEILSKVNNLLKISMPGRAESLNVSIAAGIVMHYISTK